MDTILAHGSAQYSAIKTRTDEFVSCSSHVYCVQPLRGQSIDAAFRVDFSITTQDTFDSMRSGKQTTKAGSFFSQFKPGAIPKSNSSPAISTTEPTLVRVDSAPASQPKQPEPEQPIASDQKSKPVPQPAERVATAEQQSENVHKPSQPAKPKPVHTAVVAPVTAKSKEQSKQIAKLFEDDDDDDEMQNAAPVHVSKPSTADSSKPRVARVLSDSETEAEPETEPKDIITDAPMPAAPQSAVSQQDDTSHVEPQRARKRRRVRKTKTVQDGKYIKTVDYSDWESYSEDDGATIPKHEPKTGTTHKSTTSKQHPSRVAHDSHPIAQLSSDADHDIEQPKSAKSASAAAGKASKKSGGAPEKQKTLLSFFNKK
eukprot:jgi/Hompol1/809/HPOL_004513-RA